MSLIFLQQLAIFSIKAASGRLVGQIFLKATPSGLVGQIFLKPVKAAPGMLVGLAQGLQHELCWDHRTSAHFGSPANIQKKF